MVDLTDVSLVDEDAKPILADHTNRAIPGNLEMQVAPPGDQILEQMQVAPLEVKFATSASGSFRWPSLDFGEAKFTNIQCM